MTAAAFALASALVGCSGSSSGGGPSPTPTASEAGPNVSLGRTTRLFEPMSQDRVHNAIAHISSLPGVVSVVFLWQKGKLRVVLSPNITASQRNAVVQAVATAANG